MGRKEKEREREKEGELTGGALNLNEKYPLKSLNSQPTENFELIQMSPVSAKSRSGIKTENFKHRFEKSLPFP